MPSYNGVMMYLVFADKPPQRLVRHGEELRTILTPMTMFAPSIGIIRLRDIVSIDIIAPYNEPSRKMSWLLLGIAIGLLCSSLPGAIIASAIPFSLALVSWIIPNATSSAYVLAKIKEGDRTHSIAIQREALSEFGQWVPEASWNDEVMPITSGPMLERERFQLAIMQIGFTLVITSFSIIALLGLEIIVGKEESLLALVIGKALRISLYGAEAFACLIFVACWWNLIKIWWRHQRQHKNPTPS